MAERHLPVRPNIEQLKHQAKDLLRDVRRGDAAALAEFRCFFDKEVEPAAVKLAQAQHALARSYNVPSWPRLVLACKIIDAIWRDDGEAVRALVADTMAAGASDNVTVLLLRAVVR